MLRPSATTGLGSDLQEKVNQSMTVLENRLGLEVMAFCSGCILLASAFARALKDAIVPMASVSCAFL